MNKTVIKKIWDQISVNFDIGTLEDFTQKMSTTEGRRSFWDAMKTKNVDLGTFENFEKKITQVSKPKVKRVVPPELKNLENGIKKFQDWLDDKLPNWATGYKDGKINRGQNGGGYGTYGPRTEKAWKTEGIADKFMKFVSTGSNSNAGSSSDKPEEELEDVYGKPWDQIIANN